jgi:hypothetical protein
MNNSATKTLLAAAVLAFLTLDAGNLRADVTNMVSVNATALTQGSTTVVLGVEIIEPPKSCAINTGRILEWLALDEYAESNYVASNFPAGAQLVEVVEGTRKGVPILVTGDVEYSVMFTLQD